jgi:hypothetical protein
MTETSPLARVMGGLTGEQRQAIVARFTGPNPHWDGADAADILDALADSDSDLDKLEPFYAVHEDLVDFAADPYLDAVSFATRALIWSGQRLQPAVIRALCRGHAVTYDPTHGLSSVLRWTCTRCGQAVLDNRGHVYGGAIEADCAAPEARWP